uniref:Uncharacterized protein n=1 Tax=Arundo donax TaxID=35708 RepID=A0A0A9AAF1_ARUDO
MDWLSQYKIINQNQSAP